ncbi:3-oxoacyl-[acyl-carrier-protein] synthase-3 [Amycolatopsis bartoniae]|uniref:Beta-ketoacyl-[acyl-carrier-protein] synthase III n=1 Tax=Amycolatopsis bartoniae TaxID=941986 RepID=A0A8H9M5U6_9PSEU|nr:beta-ketoacyl-ACP synthase III [Amycolatopsis bartoniae]MBB2933446.1 3-oxoacyl-[acyl-carrier-protein] synthase-3 [Amycolatopsis bartoniae]TVT06592.1 ketoacyl-ACP synthase III [Amycolatopsis bartoniae]GHF59510.1 3-oxoacyl-[acyl-carrier-protein] synthase 3 [Amycolatopsis bartoniae]
MQKAHSAVLAGLGAWLPPRVVDNHELSRRLDTSDEWIRTRTGIRERRVADPEMSTVDLAVQAGANALRSAGSDVVDALVLATSTADHLCPASAPQVASGLGLNGVAALDVNAVCSGFVYALATAGGLIAAGVAGRVLVIGADVFSRMCDPDDRSTVPIFGDGAGAVVLRAGSADEPGAIGPFDLHSDGELAELLIVPAGGARQRESADRHDHFLSMQGTAVYRHACARMAESARTVLERAGLDVSEVDRFVGHQANLRILHATAKQLGLPEDRVVANIGHTGNTSAASIPLALADACEDGSLVPGHRVLMAAFGAGLTWGSTLLTWPDVKPG